MVNSSPASLERDLAVNTHPEFFCFGLLERFDVKQLTALVAIELAQAWIDGEPPLLELRTRRGITRDTVVARLIESLALDVFGKCCTTDPLNALETRGTHLIEDTDLLHGTASDEDLTRHHPAQEIIRVGSASLELYMPWGHACVRPLCHLPLDLLDPVELVECGHDLLNVFGIKHGIGSFL